MISKRSYCYKYTFDSDKIKLIAQKDKKWILLYPEYIRLILYILYLYIFILSYFHIFLSFRRFHTNFFF